MITILFWNVGRQPRREQITQLAVSFDVDVILLAEAVDGEVELLGALNQVEVKYNFAPAKNNAKILVFTRLPKEYITPLLDSDRLTIRKVNLPGTEEILLAVVHFPSKINWSKDSQAIECARLAGDVQKAEEIAGHQKTVLVGDFNMNPFESGMVSAGGLHAVMDRQVAKRVKRIVQERAYPFFYNPMWSLLGDATPGPPGTLFHARSEHKVYFWNMFDQVLIRPALLERFRMDDLAIIVDSGNQSLQTDAGRPNTKTGSDHFPILFRLSL
jgi:endonuclease/exonuclease/phosphatase family metal-dependent hydrolase